MSRQAESGRNEVPITAADGHVVRNIALRRGADSLVIICHGITSDKNEGGIYTRLAEEVLAPKIDSIRFDFRGHGESALSPEQCTIAGELLDLMAVVGWARTQPYRHLHLVAASFGGGIALLAATPFRFENYFQRAVLWNPVVNYRNTFTDATTPWGRTFFNQASPQELAQRAGTPIPNLNFVIGPQLTMELLTLHPEATSWPPGVPLLIIHGDADSFVPWSDAADYAAANGARFVSLPGVDHGFGVKLDDAMEMTRAWLAEQ